MYKLNKILMLLIFLPALCIFSPNITIAAIINASSCSNDSIQVAVDSSKDGDTVTVPKGNCTWTSPVYILNKRITLQGAGIDETIITDNTPSGSGNSPLHIRMDSNKAFRITGLTFNASDARNRNHANGQIWIEGVSKTWRVDHVKITNNTYRGIYAQGYLGETYGVIDHCTFEVTTNVSAQSVSINGNNQGTIPGDNSWDLPLTLGSGNAVYVEDCIFNYAYLGDGVVDAYRGARYVFRKNAVNGTSIGHHGFDSGGMRSTHSFEIYNNTFTTTANIFTAIHLRGGTGVIHNNTFTGDYALFTIATNYRSCPNYEGSATNSSDSSNTLVDSGANFSSVTANGRWTIYNVSDGSYCLVTGVIDNHTLVCSGLTAGSKNIFHNGDKYGIASYLNPKGMCMGTGPLDGNQAGLEGYICYDQIGRTTQQALAPLYQWGNNYKGDPSPKITVRDCARQRELHIINGRDYYDNVKMPNYTPYTYPHPLTGPSSPINLRLGEGIN